MVVVSTAVKTRGSISDLQSRHYCTVQYIKTFDVICEILVTDPWI